MSIGAGLLTTLTPDSGIGAWLGYQILFGAGVGMSLEQCNIAVQAVLEGDELEAGTSLVLLARSLGGSIAIAIGESVFEQQLRGRLATLSGIPPSVVEGVLGGSGATDLIENVSKAADGRSDIVQEVLRLYNASITDSFYTAVALAGLTAFAAIGVEWKSVKKGKGKKDGDIEEAKSESRASSPDRA